MKIQNNSDINKEKSSCLESCNLQTPISIAVNILGRIWLAYTKYVRHITSNKKIHYICMDLYMYISLCIT